MAIRQDEINQKPWSEEDLVRGIVAGDAKARCAFVNLCHDAAYAFACKLSTDPSLRGDWTHDCILRLIADIADQSFSFRGPGSLWGWFRKRAWFLIMESRRTHYRQTVREISDGGEAAISFHGSSSSDQGIESTEISEAIIYCLDGLESADQRRVLTLLLLRNMEYQEIATEVNSPVNTIRAWIRRGRLKLRQCLARRLDLEWKE